MRVRRIDISCRKEAISAIRWQPNLLESILNRSTSSVPIESICKQFGVKEISKSPMNVDGYLAKLPFGFAIRVNPDHPKSRRRFTIAHEFGHLLLSGYLHSLGTASPLEARLRINGISMDEERTVDMIAAEILMPDVEVNSLMQRGMTSWDLIQHLVRAYEVSWEAAIKRWLTLTTSHCIWIVGNQESFSCTSALCSTSVCTVLSVSTVWERFCRISTDGSGFSFEARVRDSDSKLHVRVFQAKLKVMNDMKSKAQNSLPLKKYWLLAEASD
jgi:Zn-dependent peptidase ImmA (M78 family)